MNREVEKNAQKLCEWLAKQMGNGASCEFEIKNNKDIYEFSMNVPGLNRDPMLLVTLIMLEDRSFKKITFDLDAAGVPKRLMDEPAQRVIYKEGVVTLSPEKDR